MLGSGLWLILSERFDPHSAKRYFGQIAGAGTLGGLAGGLLRGLRDERFDVRFQCARSLAAIVRANPQLRIDREAIFAIVERELVRDRASRSIGLLVTILSLVLPAEPLRIAFQGLRSGDPVCAVRPRSISKACCRRRFASDCSRVTRRTDAGGDRRGGTPTAATPPRTSRRKWDGRCR